LFVFAALLAGGLAYNAVGAVAGGIIGVLGVEACSILALGFWLDVFVAGSLSTSPGWGPYILPLLHSQLPFAVLLIACPLVFAVVYSEGEALAIALIAAPVIAVLTYVHVNLLQWMLAADFGGKHTDAFSEAFGRPDKIRGLDYSGLQAVATQRVNQVIWGPTTKAYCIAAVVAALVAALLLKGLRRGSIMLIVAGAVVAGLAAPTLASRVPPRENYAALPGQNDTCDQRLAKLSDALINNVAAVERLTRDVRSYHPECLPPGPQVKAHVEALTQRQVLLDASESSGFGLEYMWLLGDTNRADGLAAGKATYRYSMPGNYQPRLIVRDAFGRSQEWTSAPVAVR
jgi:hypothetical protein